MTSPFSDLIPTTGAAPAARPVLSQYVGHYQDFAPALSAWRATNTGSNGATGGTPATGATPASTTNPALNQFANSAGMQFQQQQSANALNNLYAARGEIESGAAMKEIPSYLQQQALQNYFMPYMGLLGQQQSVGAGAASSIAGVGSSYGNTAANINSNLGSNSANINGQMAGYIGNGADAASNAAIARGAAGATLGAGIASGLGTLGSSFYQPTYGGGLGGSVGPINVNPRNTVPFNY